MKSEKHATFGTDTMHRLSVCIRERMGLNFAPERWADLERGLRHAASDFGFHGETAAVQCAEWLLATPLTQERIDTLARHLTIGETYFFRDPPVFEALRRHVLPELVRVRRLRGERTLRIWSAACCTGEEPYSLAILLTQTLPSLVPDWQQWHISILGTDLNPHFLKKAERGVYSSWSFRDGARDEQSRFFRKTATGQFEINAEIRRMVKFAPLNFITDQFPSPQNGTAALDLIFCRNVLMYFQKAQARIVVEKLTRCLIEEGFLAPSASEASAQLFAPLQAVTWPGSIFYRKTDAPPAPAPRRVVTSKPALPAAAAPPKPVKAAHQPAVAPRAPKSDPAASDANSPQAWHELARRCANEGQLSEALRWCDRAIATEKMNARHHYLRASILMEHPAPHSGTAANTADIEHSLRRAIYLEPDFALAHFALGNLERRRGDAPAARKSFNTALRLLAQAAPQTPLPESEDLTAGHLAEIIAHTLEELNR